MLIHHPVSPYQPSLFNQDHPIIANKLSQNPIEMMGAYAVSRPYSRSELVTPIGPFRRVQNTQQTSGRKAQIRKSGLHTMTLSRL